MTVILVFIFFIIIVSFIIGIIKGMAQTIKKTDDIYNTQIEYQADVAGSFKHVGGLPVPSGVEVTVLCTRNKLTIKKDSQEISLDTSKITAIDGVKGKDLQSQASGAFVGGLLFGLTGAIIGVLGSSSTYMVITYESNGETKYITLDSEPCSSNVKNITDYYSSQLAGKISHIEL